MGAAFGPTVAIRFWDRGRRVRGVVTGRVGRPLVVCGLVGRGRGVVVGRGLFLLGVVVGLGLLVVDLALKFSCGLPRECDGAAGGGRNLFEEGGGGGGGLLDGVGGLPLVDGGPLALGVSGVLPTASGKMGGSVAPS